MATRTIYVSDDLKARMDAVSDPPNWSEVACKAFEAALGEISAKKGRKTMADVVQRLRASKLEATKKTSARGAAAGAWWAKNEATYEQLQRIAAGADTAFGDEASPADVVLLANGDDGETVRDRFETWAAWNREAEHIEDPDYVEAFVAAAVEVFDEVSDQL